MKRFLGLLMVVATVSVAHADEKDQWSCDQVKLPNTTCTTIIEEGDLITVEGSDVMRFCDFNKQIVHLYSYKNTDTKVFGCVLKRLLFVSKSSGRKDRYTGLRWWEQPIQIDIEPRNQWLTR